MAIYNPVISVIIITTSSLEFIYLEAFKYMRSIYQAMKFTVKRFPVGGRVLKTALAVTLAIFIAQQLNLERVNLAAIVALITVQKTFYHSLLQSMTKIGSVLIGAILGTIFSLLFGLSPLSYGLVIIAVIYICLQLQWQEHIVLTAITAITVIFSTNGDTVPLLFSIQQIFTALLGATSGLFFNFLFTPNHKKEAVQKLLRAEEGLRRAIDFIMHEMLDPGCSDETFKAEIDTLNQVIEEGLEISKLLQGEQRFIINRDTDSDRFYKTFLIFKSQLSRLEEMHNLARRIPVRVPQTGPVVQLFRIVQRMQRRAVTGRKNHYELVNQMLTKMEESFSESEPPQTRKEFISQASLFHLFREIKRYYRRMQEAPAMAVSK